MRVMTFRTNEFRKFTQSTINIKSKVQFLTNGSQIGQPWAVFSFISRINPFQLLPVGPHFSPVLW